jgi:hypothetical protein
LSKIKGIVLIRDEKGKESIQTKYIYLRMKNSGRKIDLIVEASTYKKLNKKLGRR